MTRPNSSSNLRLSRFAQSRLMRCASACALGAAVTATPAGVAAQDQAPETFTLPSASPTPTPAPQGPADEVVGVPIGPRVIPDSQEREAPAPTPAAAPPPVARPVTGPTPTPTPSAARAPTSQAPAQTERTPTRSNSPSAATNVAPSVAGAPVDAPASPGFDGLFDAQNEEQEALAPRRPDGWYSVDETGNEAQAGQRAQAADGAMNRAADQTSHQPSIATRLAEQSGVTAALLALMAVLAAILGWVVWQRKKAEAAIAEAPATILTAGVRASMGEEADSQTKEKQPSEPIVRPSPPPFAPPAAPPPSAPVAPPPAPSAPLISNPKTPAASSVEVAPLTPLNIDLALDIISASRSLMRLSVEFTLEITNRGDTPLKALNLAGELACVQEGAARHAPVDKTVHLTSIDRIAPGQSRRVSGTLKLPMDEVTAIAQNGKPVVIPLTHFRLGTADQNAVKRTFVVGTPSSTSVTRVHPLVFDGPPGGLPPLRAQLIKHP